MPPSRRTRSKTSSWRSDPSRGRREGGGGNKTLIRGRRRVARGNSRPRRADRPPPPPLSLPPLARTTTTLSESRSDGALSRRWRRLISSGIGSRGRGIAIPSARSDGISSTAGCERANGRESGVATGKTKEKGSWIFCGTFNFGGGSGGSRVSFARARKKFLRFVEGEESFE